MDTQTRIVEEHPSDRLPGQRKTVAFWLWTLALILVLTAGAYLRLVGLDWDQDQHLHPDERFLTMVASALRPLEDPLDYFNTAQSTLNPHNVGYGFYVYGTLPLFLVRFAADLTRQVGYDEIHLVGRFLAALADLLTVLLVFLTARRLYRKTGLAVLAAAFSAVSVLPIQLSHYFTVDTFANFFIFLAFHFAVRVFTEKPAKIDSLVIAQGVNSSESDSTDQGPEESKSLKSTDVNSNVEITPSTWKYWDRAWETALPFALFGLALGLALASKISAAPVALLLPVAAWIYYASLDDEQKQRQAAPLLRNLVIAALVAILAFRIFQPYAFEGLGFNPRWLDNMKELSAQSGGDVDFPPALQWARRPLTFAWENMVRWGLGLPLGLLAWAGFLWMGWRMTRGEWRQHLLILGWTGVYFLWQSLSFTRSMRYQLPVYPTLAIIAAWAVYTLGSGAGVRSGAVKWLTKHWQRILAALIGVGVLTATAVYAFAFSRIYVRPVTRVAASEWIYQNVPAAINLRVDTATGVRNQPLPFQHGVDASMQQPAVFALTARQTGTLVDVIFEHVVDVENDELPETLIVRFSEPQSSEPLAYGFMVATFMEEGDPRGKEYKVMFDGPVAMEAGQEYLLSVETASERQLRLSGTLRLGLFSRSGMTYQTLPDCVQAILPGEAFTESFTAVYSGQLTGVFLPHVVDWEQTSAKKLLRLSILREVDGQVMGQAALDGTFRMQTDPRGEGYTFTFDPAVPLQAGERYHYSLDFDGDSGRIALYGSKHANESSWDDVLPLSLHGYNPYDFQTGLYRTDLNFEMYWDDNAEKLERFIQNLDTADYLFLSSNRQWGTTTRVPERYPLTTAFYRDLLGCPDEREVFWCYAVAEPGMFQGKLGFELVYINQSVPIIGNARLNTQFAEEAFTVYDAPKVMIFKKTAGYDAEALHSILKSVDLSRVVRLTPRQASKYPGNLILSAQRQKTERAGGTWSALFSRNVFFNRYPFFALLLWYLAATLLGWMVYPFVRLSLGGLADKGYPFARLVGFILLGYFTWLAGSLGVPVTRLTISLVLLFLLLVNGLLFLVQRDGMVQEIRSRWRYILLVEIFTLGFFAFFLLIRLGNPDLWHPAKGGEKPMDFSYFNAVIKSTNFPPYDPWFAGGYLNYYYYGFVLSGMLVKWLGIIPSIAYNLILPTWFSMLAMAAFSVGWNLKASNSRQESGSAAWFEGIKAKLAKSPGMTAMTEVVYQHRWPILAGLGSAVLLLVLGNLGTVRMIWHGWIKLAVPGADIQTLTFWERWGSSLKGMLQWLMGQRFSYPQGDWYWIPSRVYPNEPITEFPFFTFLYADPHAHLFALPVTVLAIGWALSVLRGRWKWDWDAPGWLGYGVSLLLGGLVIGALWPTNTWDFPTYLALGVIAVLYTGLRHAPIQSNWRGLPPVVQRLLLAGGTAVLLVGLSLLLYQPYFRWYGQGYNEIIPWEGDHSPFWSYITHWGLFLFILISWLVWETRDWMASTPVSSLRKLSPYLGVMVTGVLFLAAAVIALHVEKVAIGWLVLPLATWAGLLLLRPGQPDAKRAVQFMTGTALVLTLAVELVVLRGDIGRMNTVFKFYLQAWCLFALSAGAALIWLLPAVRREWLAGWRVTWQVALILLVFGAFLFTFTAGTDKMRDRMSRSAPHALDGMTYMATSTYSDNGRDMDLNQDDRAIRWMQENVKGSPVIVEANTVEYRWGSRFTIYTGLPGVVGWNWHQRQQRALTPSEWVTDRVEEIGNFYRTDNRREVQAFLQKYDVSYIVVGQLERAYFLDYGLDKFPAWNGDLWYEVYRDRDTVIYQVNK